MLGEGTTAQRGAPRGAPGNKPRWPIIAVLVGWALVVVVGAGPSVDDSLLGVEGVDDVLTVMLFAAAFAGLMFFIYINPFTGDFTPPERKRYRFLGVLFVVVLLLLWRPNLVRWLTELGDDVDTQAPPQEGPAGSSSETDVETREVVVQLTDVLLLLGALMAVGAVWWYTRSRQGPEAEIPGLVDAADPVRQTELAGAVGQATLALDAEDDPRLAVLKAYAILEQTLAGQGAPRLPTETPREHLGRALRAVAADTSSLMALADLYELARFSERPITTEDRNQAAVLLDDAQRQLATSGASGAR